MASLQSGATGGEEVMSDSDIAHWRREIEACEALDHKRIADLLAEAEKRAEEAKEILKQKLISSGVDEMKANIVIEKLESIRKKHL